MKILWIFISVISLLNLTSSLDVSCRYASCGGYVIWGYCCDVKGNFEITSPSNTKIHSVSTNHGGRLCNDDVIIFHAPYKNIQYFPTNIESFYRNIQAIFLYSCHLKELHGSDLKPFTKLNEIFLGSNDIEILEEGLFEFNLDLKSIVLNNNKISHIHANVFDNLSKLTHLYLSKNTCIDVDIKNDQAAVQRLIAQTKTQCQDSTFISVINQVKSLNNESKFISFENFQQFRIKVENLEIQIKSSKFSKFSSLINSLKYFKNIEKPESKTAASPKIESLKMLDTCSTFDSKFQEFSSNFTSIAMNHAKDSHNACINETLSFIDKKLSNIVEEIDKKMSVVNQKLSIFDDQFGLSEKIFSFGEKLLNFDEKLILFNDKFSFLDEKLSDFDEKLTNFGENTIDLINGQLQKMLIKKIEKIEKYLEEKFGEIL